MWQRHEFCKIFIDSFKLQDIDDIKPGFFVVTLNIEQFVLAHKDEDYREIINSSDLIVADGVGIELALRYFFGKSNIYKVAGIDLAEKLIQKKDKIALLGAKQEVIEVLQEKFSDKIVFAHHGFFDSSEEENIAREIKNLQPELILVALGSPRQEEFIFRYKDWFKTSISIGVGGSFDIWSGALKRAPKMMVDLKLEWLFRIVQEPSRLKRFLYNVRMYFNVLASSLFDER